MKCPNCNYEIPIYRGEGLNQEFLWMCPYCSRTKWVSIYGEAKCDCYACSDMR